MTNLTPPSWSTTATVTTELSFLHASIAPWATRSACSTEMSLAPRDCKVNCRVICWTSANPAETAKIAATPMTKPVTSFCMLTLPQSRFHSDFPPLSLGQSLTCVEGLGALVGEGGFHLFLKLFKGPHFDLAHPLAA